MVQVPDAQRKTQRPFVLPCMLILLITLLIVACDSSPVPTPTSEPKLTATVGDSYWSNTKLDITKEELDEARRKWRESDITNYSVSLYYQGGWIRYSTQIEVRNDQPKLLWIEFFGGKRYSTDTSRPGTPITESDEFSSYRYADFTVDKQFQVLEQELTSYDPTRPSQSCYVKFDQTYSYPSLKKCDAGEISDTDYTLRVIDFQKIVR